MPIRKVTNEVEFRLTTEEQQNIKERVEEAIDKVFCDLANTYEIKTGDENPMMMAWREGHQDNIAKCIENWLTANLYSSERYNQDIYNETLV